MDFSSRAGFIGRGRRRWGRWRDTGGAAGAATFREDCRFGSGGWRSIISESGSGRRQCRSSWGQRALRCWALDRAWGGGHVAGRAGAALERALERVLERTGVQRAGRLGDSAALQLLQSVEYNVGSWFNAALLVQILKLAQCRAHGRLDFLRGRDKPLKTCSRRWKSKWSKLKTFLCFFSHFVQDLVPWISTMLTRTIARGKLSHFQINF